MNHKEFFIISTVTSLATITLFFTIGFIQANFSVIQNNIVLATTIKPETFTVLYFEDHLNLPRSVKANEQQSFSFTIHNLEHKTMSYPYEIYIEDASGSASEIVRDSIQLKHDERHTITEWFELLQPVDRAKVVVNLIDKKQQIHFWLGEKKNEI